MNSDYWPFAVLASSVVLVVFLITRLRFHPFVALILSAIFVGLLSPTLPSIAGQIPLITALELPMQEFGVVAGKIAWVIALAAVIGTAMMKSGAAEQIVNWLLNTLGTRRAALALVLSGFVLSIPVFFDTVFFLLIPLAITLALKTGKDFVLYVAAIGGGAAISHGIIPPTPGPLIMAEMLSIDLGVVILAGLLAGILPIVVILKVAKRLNEKLDIPVRIADASVATVQHPPSVLLSTLPILVPIAMISLASIVEVLTGNLPDWVAFQGNKNFAMSVGAIIALYLWASTQKLGRQELWNAISKPLEIAGIIILITSAGGAYGAMIKHSGIGDAIMLATDGFSVHYVFLAWLVAAVMKTAQGSSTVAMITSSAIMAAIIGTDAQLGYHPVYILLSIGFGAMFISWMNDSGFWIVSRMSGFTEKEALQIWTFLLATISVVGLLQVFLMSWLLPFV